MLSVVIIGYDIIHRNKAFLPFWRISTLKPLKYGPRYLPISFSQVLFLPLPLFLLVPFPHQDAKRPAFLKGGAWGDLSPHFAVEIWGEVFLADNLSCRDRTFYAKPLSCQTLNYRWLMIYEMSLFFLLYAYRRPQGQNCFMKDKVRHRPTTNIQSYSIDCHRTLCNTVSR